jgi:hypothetical protein
LKSDAEFVADLSASRRAVNSFANRQRAMGLQIWLPPESVRPDSSQRREYADEGDLMLQGRVEHKARSLQFTSRDDYPYDTVIVDECYKVDGKADPVLAYVIENAARTHAAVIYGWTRDHWERQVVYDAKQRRQCENYVAPKRYVRFVKYSERVF